ncbi:hypothetical protein N431DRAFT_543550 [Stipitochalara longipes BDJ]|nr:hypothetical protein N431DRAFT_543550 [Stipitochalara longipes BDJ]
MVNKNPPDERVVYLALKNVFKGSNADAKIRFPEVFDVSPAQSAEREASEAEAARNDAIALKDAVQATSVCFRRFDTVRLVAHMFSGFIQIVETCRDPQLNNKLPPSMGQGSRQIPLLFPVYLPFRTQHQLLIKHAMPDVLQQNQWDCPESAELNLWATEFLRRQSAFAEKGKNVGKSLEKLFRSVADIRHSAVHRIRVSARGIEQFIFDAESLATLLGDEVCVKSLTNIRRDTQLAIEELERNKHVLSSKLTKNLKKIAAARAELDRLEEEAIAEMVKEDGEYQVFAGTNLEQAIASSEETTVTAAATEKGTSSDVDDIDSAEGSEECQK